jgi:hypothetical protein
MNAKRWAAHAAVMATLMAGLTACGGGGDGAATETKAPEEVLTAGLTLREGSGPVAANGTYSVKLDAVTTDFMPLTPASNDTNKTGYTTAEFSENATTPRLFGSVTFKTTTGEVEQVILVANTPNTDVGCGTRYATPCTGLTVNPATGGFTAKSVVLKALNDDWDALDTTVGQVIVSGIFTPTAP